METNFSAIINILTSPPGDPVYHLVISLALILTGILALAKVRPPYKNDHARHVLIGCSNLLLIQILLFGLRYANIHLLFDSFLIYLIAERLAAVLTVIWLFWTFLEEDKHFYLTGFITFLTLILILIATFSLVFFSLQTQIFSDNNNLIDFLWQGSTLLLILVALILILARRPQQWRVATAMLVMIAVGYFLQLTLSDTVTSRMGAVRLAQTLSLPWVIVLVQRFGNQETALTPPDETTPNETPELDNTALLVDVKPTLVDYLLKIAIRETAEEKFKAIVRALSLSVVADICYLVHLPKDQDKIHLIGGYDLIREEFLQTHTLPRDDLLHIMISWEQNQILNLSQAQPDTRDTATLARLLKYHSTGSVLAYPLGLPEQPLVGGVIFLSPYTNKQWGEKTLTLMDEIKDTLATVLFAPDSNEQIKAELDNAMIEINTLIEENETLLQALAEKEAAVNEYKTSNQQLKARYQIEKLKTVQHIDQLRAHIAELTSQVASQKEISTRLEHLQAEIRQLTSERDQLMIALAKAEARLKDLDDQAGQTGPIRLSMENQIISLDSITANVRMKIAHQLQQKDIGVEITNPNENQMIKTDPELLQSVLLGLLQNAILASEPGGTIQLSQKLSFETGMLIIQVTDFGEGLTQSEQTAFFSAEHETISGIGSIQSIRDAIRAIRVLNGKVWLRSKKEAFTTFRVQLPVRIID